MSADNVSPLRPEATAKPPRKTKRTSENFAEMPSNIRLLQALHGVSSAAEAESVEPRGDEDVLIGLCTAAEILSKMLWESLTNTGAA
jgi:hypothetical protein